MHLPTPPGVCFTTQAYRLILEPLEEKILARASFSAVLDPIEIENVAVDIRTWIEQAPLPASVEKAMNDALAALPSTSSSYIARTSMTSEELASAFGSGVKRAFLGLVGETEITQGIAKCWSTPFTSRALYYRNRKKIKQTSVNLGVLVQPMVHASAAGMMFTANPHNGAAEELVVESIWGLGEPATSARVRPDRFVIDKRTGAVRSSELTSKLVKLDLAPDGHLQQLGVPEGQQDTPSLNDDTLSRLAELGRQIEELFSAPQEIEWAFADQKLSILQTRPIGQRI